MDVAASQDLDDDVRGKDKALLPLAGKGQSSPTPRCG